MIQGVTDLLWSGPPEKLRDTAYAEDASTGYTRNGPQVMAALPIAEHRHQPAPLAGITEITRTLQRIARDRTRALLFLPL